MARRNQPAEADPLLGPGEKQFAVVKQQPQPWTHLLRTKRRRKCACVAVAVVLPCVVVGTYYAVADVEESLDDGAERFLASPYNVTCSEYDDDVVYSATTCKSQDWGFCYKGDKTFSVDGAASEDDDATTASYTTCVNGTACYDWCNAACEQGWGAYCVWDIYANLEAACAGIYTPTAPGRRRLRLPRALRGLQRLRGDLRRRLPPLLLLRLERRRVGRVLGQPPGRRGPRARRLRDLVRQVQLHLRPAMTRRASRSRGGGVNWFFLDTHTYGFDA